MIRQRLDQTFSEWFRVPERNHLLLMVALCCLLGGFCASHLTHGGWLWLLALIGLALAVLLKLLGRRAGVGLAILFFAVGALRTHAAMTLPQPEPGTYDIAATVCGGATQRSDRRLTCILTDLTLDGTAAEGKAYCSIYYSEEPPALFDGARIHFRGSAYLPREKDGAPHLDFRLWMLQRGLNFGVMVYSDLLVDNTPETAPITDPWYRMREALGRMLERAMGGNARIATALLLGDRSGLTEEENQAFQELGIAHVMSVSGLHVSILGGILCWLMDRLRMRRLSQLPVLGVFLMAYCALTGFSSAAIRAAVMLLSYSLARVFLRYPDRLTVLAGSLLAVLMIQPLQIFSAGFVLSYCAMLGITLHSHALHDLLGRLWPENLQHPARKRRRIHLVRALVIDSLTISITAQLGVLLPTMIYFHQLPLYGVAINLIIVPLVSSVLMPLYLFAIPFSFVPLLGQAVGGTAALMTDLLLWLVGQLSLLPYAAIRTPAPSTAVAVGLGLVLVVLSRRIPGSLHKRLCAAGAILLTTLGIFWLQQPAEVRYLQLAVGQADCALLMDGPTTVLIDCGADATEALDYLMDENRNLDALIITHLHLDHIGGVEQLLNSPVAIRHVYLPAKAAQQRIDPEGLALLERLKSEGIPVTELARGDELRYNKTSLRVLWPPPEPRTGHPANEMPLVCAIHLDGYTLLSASDLEGIYENYAAAPADVLKVAHHGSSHSSGEAFLHFVSPRYALISASGSRGLPGDETLQRLEEAGAEILRTDLCGDITLTVEDGQLTVTPYKAR